jgi:WhiB family transcriptional regulator, redox-sensing transcriptional regulator
MAVAAPQCDDGVDAIDGAALLAALLAQPAWHADAACRGHGPDMYFPPRHPSPDDHHRACCVCRGCPVRLECLTFALDLPSSATPGIWGGSTERARRRARRGLTAAQLLAELDGGATTSSA